MTVPTHLQFVADAARVAGWNDKRRETAHRITREARRLCADRGFDEFTLDELASAAEVSRRTLFNYFDGKMEAVLGLPPASVLPLLEKFCAGGPTGDLYDDACRVGRDLLEDKGMTRDEWATMHLALERNPKLLAATATTFRGVCEDLLVLIAQRENEPADSPRVVIALTAIGALFEATVRTFIDPSNRRPMGDIFDSYQAALRDLTHRSH